jgi:hypothetical protein
MRTALLSALSPVAAFSTVLRGPRADPITACDIHGTTVLESAEDCQMHGGRIRDGTVSDERETTRREEEEAGESDRPRDREDSRQDRERRPDRPMPRPTIRSGIVHSEAPASTAAPVSPASEAPPASAPQPLHSAFEKLQLVSWEEFLGGHGSHHPEDDGKGRDGCVKVSVRYDGGGSRLVSPSDFEASFADGSTRQGEQFREGVRLERGQAATGVVCFGGNFQTPITSARLR